MSASKLMLQRRLRTAEHLLISGPQYARLMPGLGPGSR